MACNASGDVKVPLCSSRGCAALSSILLGKCACRHGPASFLSSHKSIAAECVLKWRGTVRFKTLYVREGSRGFPVLHKVMFILYLVTAAFHADCLLGFRGMKTRLWKYAFWLWGLTCSVQFSPCSQGLCCTLPLPCVSVDLKHL